ncbi:MAG: exonuclease domain-containing protein [Planktothrix agardhii]|jgi:DNA polymerase III epsilon subunit-like protein|uniref:exonuclease domain-containing protein n=1 Tax=Planktothrix agardhii TaxID=1160 RepID=UPI0020A7AFAD|nr:DNA polymerase III [Planktothrix agardhii]
MKTKKNFIVIDTEGQPILRELAIVNDQGELIYEAFVENHPQSPKIAHLTKPLKVILQEFLEIAQSQIIICHYAQNDIEILRNSFKAVGISAPQLDFQCSFELAQRYLPQLNSHSLEALSKHLRLKLEGQFFIKDSAHRAKYDASFTYQLYKHIVNEFLKKELKTQPNPFGNSRVDTPFQDHPDFRGIFAEECDRLKAILGDIKLDFNHQTKGAIVIGEPGSGKTHLMMRLAKDLLTKNRLLFIRQPNNPDTVLFHTYSRILESLIQIVPNSIHTQIEYLLANSFSEIIKSTDNYFTSKTQKDEKILQLIQGGNLKLFTDLSQAETKTKREFWQHIEKRALEWWNNNFSAAGYAPKFLQGIVKFCGYTDFNRRQIITQWLAMNNLPQEELDRVGLPSWEDELSREEASLEALKVLGCLSLLDEPLIIVFDQLEGLGLKHNERLLHCFGTAIKEIFTHVPNSLIILNLFPDRWQQFKQVFDGSIIDRVSQSQVFLNRPSNQELKQLLNLKLQGLDVTLDDLFEVDEITAILNHISIRTVLNVAADYYRYKVDGIPLPKHQLIPVLQTDESDVERRLKKLEIELEQMKQGMTQIAKIFGEKNQQNLEIFNGELFGFVPSFDSAAKRQLKNYLKAQRICLEANLSKPKILTDSDDLGKLITILESLMLVISPLSFDILRLGKRVIPEHLIIQTQTHSFVVGFLHLGGAPFFHRMKNWNELLVLKPNFKFILCRDQSDYPISGEKSLFELEKLQHSKNGKLMLWNPDHRVLFELFYQMILDIQNYDLEIKFEEAMEFILSEYQDYWLFQNITRDLS